MTLPKVKHSNVYLGCDPEFFFKSPDGEIVGAEKVLPKAGLTTGYCAGNRIVIDGVQAELNPRPSFCRELLAGEIGVSFRELNNSLKKRKDPLIVDFSRTVEVSEKALMELDEKSRQFGCAPSNSIYKSGGLKISGIDPSKYRTRAAGGHIHLGVANSTDASNVLRALKTDYERTVKMLDILCGNTSVLIDRDKSNAERRKVYGRAGEFRLPSHGLEYRTLSNFWLTSYPLMSFSFGMARLAVELMADRNYEEYFKEFTNAVKPKKITDAINNNDFDLAMENFKDILELLLEVTPTNDRYAVHKNNIDEFHHFITKIDKSGLEYWFKNNSMNHWANSINEYGSGFCDFLRLHVKEDLRKERVITQE